MISAVLFIISILKLENALYPETSNFLTARKISVFIASAENKENLYYFALNLITEDSKNLKNWTTSENLWTPKRFSLVSKIWLQSQQHGYLELANICG